MGQNDNFITRQPDGKIYPACGTGKFGRSFSYELRLEAPQKSLELMLSDGLHVLGFGKSFYSPFASFVISEVRLLQGTDGLTDLQEPLD